MQPITALPFCLKYPTKQQSGLVAVRPQIVFSACFSSILSMPSNHRIFGSTRSPRYWFWFLPKENAYPQTNMLQANCWDFCQLVSDQDSFFPAAWWVHCLRDSGVYFPFRGRLHSAPRWPYGQKFPCQTTRCGQIRYYPKTEVVPKSDSWGISTVPLAHHKPLSKEGTEHPLLFFELYPLFGKTKCHPQSKSRYAINRN